jgi:hypothetical protein
LSIQCSGCAALVRSAGVMSVGFELKGIPLTLFRGFVHKNAY